MFYSWILITGLLFLGVLLLDILLLDVLLRDVLLLDIWFLILVPRYLFLDSCFWIFPGYFILVPRLSSLDPRS
jgi:hypothetical protein